MVKPPPNTSFEIFPGLRSKPSEHRGRQRFCLNPLSVSVSLNVQLLHTQAHISAAWQAQG